MIRQAKAGDGGRVGKMLDTFRREMGIDVSVAVPLPVSHDGPLFAMIAEEDDEICGLLTAQRCVNLVRGVHFMLITDIFVDQAHRRQGVALGLINETVALARRIGCVSVSLIVAESDEAVLKTAARAGFAAHEKNLLRLVLS